MKSVQPFPWSWGPLPLGSAAHLWPAPAPAPSLSALPGAEAVAVETTESRWLEQWAACGAVWCPHKQTPDKHHWTANHKDHKEEVGWGAWLSQTFMSVQKLMWSAFCSIYWNEKNKNGILKIKPRIFSVFTPNPLRGTSHTITIIMACSAHRPQ